jgi:hypothetical protein
VPAKYSLSDEPEKKNTTNAVTGFLPLPVVLPWHFLRAEAAFHQFERQHNLHKPL